MVIGTVTDRDCVRRCLQGVDVVQHIAAAFREMNVPEQHYHDVNIGGTRICLEEAFAAGVNRDVIRKGAEMTGYSVEDLTRETIQGMRAVADEIGLGDNEA